MLVLVITYLAYLVLYFFVSYAILFHLIRFRVDGDRSQVVAVLYVIVSFTIIVGSLFFLKPL